MEKVCLELENIKLTFLDRLVLDIPRLAVHQFEALERFLLGYEGTVLLVSHDLRFIDSVADCVYVMEDQQIKLRH